MLGWRKMPCAGTLSFRSHETIETASCTSRGIGVGWATSTPWKPLLPNAADMERAHPKVVHRCFRELGLVKSPWRQPRVHLPSMDNKCGKFSREWMRCRCTMDIQAERPFHHRHHHALVVVTSRHQAQLSCVCTCARGIASTATSAPRGPPDERKQRVRPPRGEAASSTQPSRSTGCDGVGGKRASGRIRVSFGALGHRQRRTWLPWIHTHLVLLGERERRNLCTCA
mmetsp:Transcript_3217/g.19964  ORF Transcript_3217/g.19964 Transcript_3217/m.19964 type:complete len:227 (-) Transcript_3217:5993-6673(-)